MSAQKEIEKTVNDINDFVYKLYGKCPKLEFDKGNNSTGITHKVFNISDDGSRKELKREVKSHDLLKWLEGYYQSLQDHVRTFRQRG